MKINFGSKTIESSAPITVYDAAKEAFEIVERSVIAASVNLDILAVAKKTDDGTIRIKSEG